MLGYLNLVNLIVRAVILVFMYLSLKVALSQARVHAAWLLPSCLGWGLVFCGYLMTLAATIAGFSGSVAEGLHLAEQVCFYSGTLCLGWSAVALYRTMKIVTAGPQLEKQEQYPASEPSGENKEVWPPPPRQ